MRERNRFLEREQDPDCRMRKKDEHFKNAFESGLPHVTNQLTGWCPEAIKLKAACRMCLTRNPIMFQQVLHSNSVFWISRTGLPVGSRR